MRKDVTMKIFEGAVSVERVDGGLKPWRCPYDRKRLFPDALLAAAQNASGVRLRFKTDSSKVRINVSHQSPEAYTEHYDLTIDGELIDSQARAADSDSIELTQPSGGSAKIAELWLPQLCPVVVESLEVDDGAELSEVEDDRLKWITHGSSITHCVRAHSPARTWPAVAARKHNLNLTALGYGGQCHIDQMVAKMIRDMPADLITLKLGINVHGQGSLNPRTFKPSVIGMIETIREKHPKTPIGIISPIICPPRENAESNGLSLRDMRMELKDAVDRIVEIDGDDKLFYFSGLDLFGEELVGPMLPDDLHPDEDGNVIMGDNAAALVLPKLLEAARA